MASYTQATGKRPIADGIRPDKVWYWLPPHHHIRGTDDANHSLPAEMWFRMPESSWPDPVAAKTAADAAYERAVAEGAMERIEGVA